MDFEIFLGFLLEFKEQRFAGRSTQYTCIQYIPILGIDSKIRQLLFVRVPTFTYLPTNNTTYNTKMESGFEDDFAPMQSSAGKTATIDDDSLILGDEDDSPKKTSEGKMWNLEAKRLLLC